jgi:hypothetical protein
MATTIRQEINVLNYGISTSGTPSDAFKFQLDTSKYVNPTYYLEVATDTVTVGTGGNGFTLRREGTTTDDVTVNTASGSTRYRSSSFTPPSGKTTYMLHAVDASNYRELAAARLIIIDNPTILTSTETQIEIGMRVGGLTSTTATKVVPDTTRTKYWTYTAANWDGTVTFYAEVTYLMASSKSSGTFVLQEDNGSFASWTDKVTIVNAGIASVATLVRSAAFTPTDGRHYRIAYVVASSKSAATIYNAKIIVDQANLLNGLQAYYRLDESANGTVTDQMGVANGSSTGVTWQAGKINNGAKFPGTSNNVITITNTLASFSQPGMAMWVKPTNTSSTEKYVTRDQGGGTNWGFMLSQDSTNVYQAGVQTVGGFRTVNSTTAVSTAALVHLAVTYDGVTLRIWVNGVNEGSSTLNEAMVSQTSKTIYIGCLNPTTQTTGALIDEVAIYDGLTGGQVAGLYNGGSGTQGAGYTAITKLEPQYLLLSGADIGTGLQLAKTLWDSTEWSGVTNTYYHAMDSDNASNSAKLQDIDNSNTDVTGSTATGANEQVSSALTMPTTGHQIDVNVTNSTGAVGASKILVAVVVTTVAAIPNKIYSYLQAVNRGGNF